MERNGAEASPVAPISHLSIELFNEIFIHCLPDELSIASAKNAPLLLCHVCSAWRAAAFGLPELWRKLSLRMDSYVSAVSAPILATLWFANAGDSSLWLSLDWYRGIHIKPKLLEDFIMSHSNRIHRLDLSLPSEAELFRFFALPPGHIDCLEHLSVVLGRSDKQEITVFQSAPRLRKVLVGTNTSIEDPSIETIFLPWAQLTHLNIQQSLPPEKWRELLRQCVLLKHCYISTLFDTESTLPGDDKQSITERPNLIDLQVRAEASSPLNSWFYEFAFPALRELEIQRIGITPMMLNMFRATLPLSSLQRLALMDTINHVADIAALLRLTTSVNELYLWLDRPGDNTNVDILWDALTYSPKRLDWVLPHLKNLNMCSTWYTGINDDKALMGCLAVVESRWNPFEDEAGLGSDVARLQQVALHVPFGDWIVPELEDRLEEYVRGGLDVRVDKQWLMNTWVANW